MTERERTAAEVRAGSWKGPALAGVLALAWTLWIFALVRGAPFLSEDYTHLATAATWEGWAQVWSPERVPLRPLQHAFFYLLAPVAGAEGAAAEARAVGFGLHLVALAALYGLARELGLSRRGAACALLALALFPSVKSLAWSAAIGTPGRTAFELGALALGLAASRRRSVLLGLAAFACFAVALAFHQSAVALPLLLALGIALCGRAPGAAGLRRTLAALLDPRVLPGLVAAGVYAAYVAFLRPERYTGLKELDALPANLAKAALCLAPEALRTTALEGLRGTAGPAGFALGAAAVLGVVALAAVLLVRGRGLVRWALVCIALDLALPVLTVGFVQRYAAFPAAFAALVLGAWWDRYQPSPPRAVLRAAVVGGLALAWAVDSVVDAREVAEAGRAVRTIVEGAREVRAEVGERRVVTLLDPPDAWGAEDDVPVLNWGLPQALDMAGVTGPFRVWRRDEWITSTDVRRVEDEELRAALVAGEVVLEYDPARDRLWRLRP